MAIISKERILKVLLAYNPWWETGTVNPTLSKTYKRFVFYEAMKRLDQIDIRRTVVLTETQYQKDTESFRFKIKKAAGEFLSP